MSIQKIMKEKERIIRELTEALIIAQNRISHLENAMLKVDKDRVLHLERSRKMKKIPTIFKRNPENMREILDEPHPDCQWVFGGEGAATRKYDGTCVKIDGGKYFKRREVKKGKLPPPGFVEEQFDMNTGKRVGWVEVDPSLKENKWHMDGLRNTSLGLPDGTYELVGPKVQKNPEGYEDHTIILHEAAQRYSGVPRNFNGLMDWLRNRDVEGLVFHHPDGRMGKIKKRDFGMRR